MRVIRLPQRCAGRDLVTIWKEFEPENKLRNADSNPVFIDLTDVRFLDAEGANYMALVPTLFKSKNIPVSLALPTRNSVLRYMDTLGLLEYLHLNFGIDARTPTETRPALQRSEEKLLSRWHLTYVATPHSISPLFRLDLIKRVINSSTARLFCTCLIELINNVFDHSGQTIAAVTLQALRGARRPGNTQPRTGLMLAVADLGVGIPKTLERAYKQRTGREPTDFDLLNFALGKGTTSTGIPGRGYGLYLSSLAANSFRVSSGKAMIQITNRRPGRASDRGNYAPRQRALHEMSSFPGTSIAATFGIEQSATGRSHKSNSYFLPFSTEE